MNKTILNFSNKIIGYKIPYYSSAFKPPCIILRCKISKDID